MIKIFFITIAILFILSPYLISIGGCLINKYKKEQQSQRVYKIKNIKPISTRVLPSTRVEPRGFSIKFPPDRIETNSLDMFRDAPTDFIGATSSAITIIDIGSSSASISIKIINI